MSASKRRAQVPRRFRQTKGLRSGRQLTWSHPAIKVSLPRAGSIQADLILCSINLESIEIKVLGDPQSTNWRLAQHLLLFLFCVRFNVEKGLSIMRRALLVMFFLLLMM